MSVSLSKSALVLSPCLRWAWNGAREYEDEFADTTKRDKGTMFHAHMDRYYKTGSSGTAPLFDVDAWVKDAILWSKQHLEPRCQEILSEVYVGFNFDTGESHTDSTVHDRKYPKDMPNFVPGTADLVCLLRDGSLLVADWKTGGGTGADKQLMSLALGLRDVFRASDGKFRPVRLAILYATEQGVHPVEWEASEGDLLAHQHAMAFQLADVGVRRDPVPGIHCTQLYCNHLAYCPGVAATVDGAAEDSRYAEGAPQGLLPAASLVRKWDIQAAPSCAEHAGSVMERVTAAKRQMDFYEKRVRKYVVDGGRCIAGDFEYSQKADGFRWRTKK